MTHYETLGVAATASRDEIRIAYRALARRLHPDSRGDASSVGMARINEAWHVLGDPARRATYDAALHRASASSAVGSPPAARESRPTYVAPVDTSPARFPWRLVAIMAVIGIAFVLVNAALTDPAKPVTPDNVLQVGSCVIVAQTQEAVETDCSSVHDGVVELLVSFDSTCPLDLETHRDRQGMGLACVRRSQSG